MAKINDTITFPNTVPTELDFVIGTDVSDTGNSADGEIVTFTFGAVKALFTAPIDQVPVLSVSAAATYGLGPAAGTVENEDNLTIAASGFVTAVTHTIQGVTGSVRFNCTQAGNGTISARLLKNGTVVQTFTGPGTYASDQTCVPGDVFIWQHSAGGADPASTLSNFEPTASNSYAVAQILQPIA